MFMVNKDPMQDVNPFSVPVSLPFICMQYITLKTVLTFILFFFFKPILSDSV